MSTKNDEWLDDDNSEEISPTEYDITATPNDFNVSTLYNFIERGAVAIPGFQRNFVWDIKRASKLIESLILGLPVPQLFLYEQSKNKFIVIDGHQRLMSIFYFKKQKFPRMEKRSEMRAIFDDNGSIPDDILYDDEFFSDFKLQLSSNLPDQPNSYNKKSYSTLGESQLQFDLRPIRNIVVRQNSPANEDSSVFEIFSRLNSGGLNLTPQEIRLSLYHSKFYDSLMSLNREKGWRSILSKENLDLHLKDVEILLRIFAILVDYDNYAPSMVKFLNQFSKKCQENTDDQNHYLISLFKSFLCACSDLPQDAFLSKKTRKFSIALIESVFYATCRDAFENKRMLNGKVKMDEINNLSSDSAFQEAATKSSTQSSNVKTRITQGKISISSL